MCPCLCVYRQLQTDRQKDSLEEAGARNPTTTSKRRWPIPIPIPMLILPPKNGAYHLPCCSQSDSRHDGRAIAFAGRPLRTNFYSLGQIKWLDSTSYIIYIYIIIPLESPKSPGLIPVAIDRSSRPFIYFLFLCGPIPCACNADQKIRPGRCRLYN